MDNHKTNQDLIKVAVEYALLQMGTPELEKVQSRLLDDHNCKIEDCLEHPEYLKQILFDLFGYCYQDILDNIEEVLKSAGINDEADKFFMVLKTAKPLEA